MPNARAVVDVTDEPELRRSAEDVRRTGEPRILRRDGEDLAVVVPLSPAQERDGRHDKTPEDLAAFRAAAGSWKDVDLETFLRDILIGATALHHDSILVTRNRRHFGRIPHLRLFP
jgi:hypothetical protein